MSSAGFGEMFNAEQSWEELDDELYREDEDSEDSLSRSELVFHLYGQLHYSSNFVELDKAEEEHEEKQDSDTSSSACSSKGGASSNSSTPAQQDSSDSSDSFDSSDTDDLEKERILGQDHSISLHPEGASGSNTDGGEGCSGWICEKNKKKLKSCFNCGALGHLANKCPDKYCRYCFQPGHTSKTCSKKRYWNKLCHRHGMKGHFSDTTDGPPVAKQAEDKGRSSAYFGHACTKQRMLEEINPRQEERKTKALKMQENCSFPFPASSTPPAQPVLEENCDFPRGGRPKKKGRRKNK